MSTHSFQLNQLPPLSLYIHIPWCVKKCPYCDFNSHNIPTGELPEARYVEALINDLTQSLPLIWGRSIQTIFIGGGTPSLFSGSAIASILDAVRCLTNLSPFAEITIEANPGAVDDSHLKGYADAGVNRISFGVQSFNDMHLQSLGRIHNSTTAINSIQLATQYFNNINLDIIYGLPKQTIGELVTDLDIALSFNTRHLSLYNLTIEPNTAFHKNIPQGLPDNDLCYQMQDEIIKRLIQHGYKRYEISAYAKESRESKEFTESRESREAKELKEVGGYNQSNLCQHNLNYWQFGDYLGIGAGAHSKLSMHDKIIRQVRQKNPRDYMNALLNSTLNNINNVNNVNTNIYTSINNNDYNGNYKYSNDNNSNNNNSNDNLNLYKINSTHIIDDAMIALKDLPFEFALNAFRLIDGFNTQLFVERTGLSLNIILPKLLIAQQKGFITIHGSEIKPTIKGVDFLNELLMLFLD